MTRKKGSVYQRGRGWAYAFTVESDPLTGHQRRQTHSGFESYDAAWEAMQEAMVKHRKGQLVRASGQTVEQFFTEWLTRIEPAVKPSMLANYRDYTRAYVLSYIGQRRLRDVDEAVLDALFRTLLTSGRVKAKPSARAKLEAKAADRQRRIDERNAGVKKRGPAPKAKPLAPAPNPGLAPKTVVNVRRMLHAAWEDAVIWRYVPRNPVKGTKAPRVPRQRRKTWTVEQLQRFLITAQGDRFFALWVLEMSTGMRRCELAGLRRDALDRHERALISFETRVVVDGRVIDSDGKSGNANRILALDPFTFACLEAQLATIAEERDAMGSEYQDHGLMFCWEDGRPPHPDTLTRRFKRLLAKAGLPEIRLHDMRHSYVTAGRRARIDWKALSERVGHATVAFTMGQYLQTDLDADREVAEAIAALIFEGHRQPSFPALLEREAESAQ